MKKIKILFFVSLVFIRVYSQDTIPPTRSHAIGQKKLTITLGFTTNLIFLYPISNVDVGSREILVKKSGPGDNVLLVKAAKKDFASTNLSVYTKEGKLYSYWVSYADTVTEFNYSYQAESDWGGVRPFLHRKVHSGGITIKLSGIYYREGLVWLSLHVRNDSPLDYFPGTVRFSIRDKKTSRKKVVQEESWEPVYSAQPLSFTQGPGSQLRYGFSARAPDKNKEIVAEWADENGERRIRMLIPARLLLRAKKM